MRHLTSSRTRYLPGSGSVSCLVLQGWLQAKSSEDRLGVAEDVAAVAHCFGLLIDDLMPRKIEETPVASGDEGSGAASQTGFEPATFCSGGTIHIPDEDQVSSSSKPAWRLAT